MTEVTINEVLQMNEFERNFSDNSIWITATPTLFAQQLPFCISEAGHFSTYPDYKVTRDFHDSFLLLYTCSGIGCIKAGNTSVQLLPNHAVIIDCHKSHEYFSQSESWDFFWIHFSGISVKSIYDIIYPDNTVYAINMSQIDNFKKNIESVIDRLIKNDIKSSLDISAKIHTLLNSMLSVSLKVEESKQKKESADDINTVIAFIEQNYKNPISVDDMVDIIHVSKYHFIRRFRRVMGITPYHYLTNHRITVAKKLLRTTNKTVSEISELCGFMDTSNFITQFKKQTGQKPLGYRHDFA